MGHTNSTANLSLPQFIGTDKPTWLGDINGAMSAIDAYAGTNDAAVSAAASDASSAISQAASAVNTANTANTTAGNASTAANNAVGVANNAVAIAGVVDGKVGLLADLTTTDRTSIVNAINEVNAAIGTPSAEHVSYDNTGSGLTATDVQAAIDELAQGGGSSETVLWTNADPSQAFAAQAVTVPSMSGYSKIRIEFIDKNTCKSEGEIIIPPEASTGYSYALTRIFEQTGDLRILTRNFDYTDATTITSSLEIKALVALCLSSSISSFMLESFSMYVSELGTYASG